MVIIGSSLKPLICSLIPIYEEGQISVFHVYMIPMDLSI